MRTGPLLTCVAALGLFVGFSCTARSDEEVRAESNAQSGNANSADEKKVTVSSGGASVEVKGSGNNNGSVEVKGSGDSGSVAVQGSGDNGAVVVKGSGEGNKSVTISAGGIGVSESTNDSSQDVVKISGVGQNLSYECEGRSFNVQGTSNTVKLSGQCQSLRVAGTTNRVDVESVATINVSGIRNQVTWERGVNNKPPRISNSGINNNVSQKGN